MPKHDQKTSSFENYDVIENNDNPILLPSMTDILKLIRATAADNMGTLYFNLMFDCLARAAEVSRLKWRDIDFDSSRINLSQDKTLPKSGWVQMSRSTCKQLHCFYYRTYDELNRISNDLERKIIRQDRRVFAYCFKDPEGGVKAALQELELVPLFQHYPVSVVRAIAAWFLKAENTDIRVIQKKMRHEDVRATEHFLSRIELASKTIVFMEDKLWPSAAYVAALPEHKQREYILGSAG